MTLVEMISASIAILFVGWLAIEFIPLFPVIYILATYLSLAIGFAFGAFCFIKEDEPERHKQDVFFAFYIGLMWPLFAWESFSERYL